jgi:hypothetical protein
MLAAIEDQQHPLVAKEGDQTGGRIAGLNQQSERRRDRVRHQQRIVLRGVSRIKALEAAEPPPAFHESM